MHRYFHFCLCVDYMDTLKSSETSKTGLHKELCSIIHSFIHSFIHLLVHHRSFKNYISMDVVTVITV
jgi:hypothetical protein